MTGKRGRPPRKDGRIYTKVGIAATPQETEYVNSEMSTDARREGMLYWTHTAGLIEIADKIADANTVAPGLYYIDPDDIKALREMIDLFEQATTLHDYV
jgi:hypothetical protein